MWLTRASSRNCRRCCSGGADPKIEMLSMTSLVAAHPPHLAARPYSQEQLLQVDRTSTTEVPDSLLGWGPAQFAGNLAAYTKGTLQTTCLVGKTAGGVMQVLQSRGSLHFVLTYLPTTAGRAQFCLPGCQPEPIFGSLAARLSQLTPREPCRLPAWSG